MIYEAIVLYKNPQSSSNYRRITVDMLALVNTVYFTSFHQVRFMLRLSKGEEYYIFRGD